MRAIFTGSIALGFGISAVLEDAAAEVEVARIFADGRLAEAVRILSPSNLQKNCLPFDGGIEFVVFTNGLGNGIYMYGPFEDSETAEEFGERNRGSDEWELFKVSAPAETDTDASLSLQTPGV